MPEDLDDYNARTKAFTDEFLAQPGAYMHPALQVTDLRFRGAGRGILTNEPIAADTVLLKIPRGYTISVESSELFRAHAEIFDELAIDSGAPEDDLLPTPWLHLILVLIHDYLHMRESKWRAYWNVLPSEFDTLMFWTGDELNELQASAIRTHIGKETADKLFLTRTIPLVRKHASVFFSSDEEPAGDEELLGLCHRMGSLIMSYAFDLQIRPSDSDSESGEDGWVEDSEIDLAMGMVPFADTMNADAEFNVHVEHETDQLVVRSLREIEAGGELLNFYGPMPNCDLARRYGYTSRLHARYDVVELPWDLIISVMKDQLGETVCNDLPEDEELEDSFALERDAGEPDAKGTNKTVAKFSKFPDDLVGQALFTTRALGISDNPRKQTERDGRSLKLAFLRIIIRVLAKRLQEYPTTVEQDEQLLSAGNLSIRVKMAIDIRIGEKTLLLEATQLAKELLQKYDGADTQRKQKPDTYPKGSQKSKKRKT